MFTSGLHTVHTETVHIETVHIKTVHIETVHTATYIAAPSSIQKRFASYQNQKNSLDRYKINPEKRNFGRMFDVLNTFLLLNNFRFLC
jgi:hypothetical protein